MYSIQGKKKLYLASRYTHGVTANQIYTDTSPCNASNPVFFVILHNVETHVLLVIRNLPMFPFFQFEAGVSCSYIGRQVEIQNKIPHGTSEYPFWLVDSSAKDAFPVILNSINIRLLRVHSSKHLEAIHFGFTLTPQCFPEFCEHTHRHCTRVGFEPVTPASLE